MGTVTVRFERKDILLLFIFNSFNYLFKFWLKLGVVDYCWIGSHVQGSHYAATMKTKLKTVTII